MRQGGGGVWPLLLVFLAEIVGGRRFGEPFYTASILLSRPNNTKFIRQTERIPFQAAPPLI